MPLFEIGLILVLVEGLGGSKGFAVGDEWEESVVVGLLTQGLLIVFDLEDETRNLFATIASIRARSAGTILDELLESMFDDAHLEESLHLHFDKNLVDGFSRGFDGTESAPSLACCERIDSTACGIHLLETAVAVVFTFLRTAIPEDAESLFRQLRTFARPIDDFGTVLVARVLLSADFFPIDEMVAKVFLEPLVLGAGARHDGEEGSLFAGDHSHRVADAQL